MGTFRLPFQNQPVGHGEEWVHRCCLAVELTGAPHPRLKENWAQVCGPPVPWSQHLWSQHLRHGPWESVACLSLGCCLTPPQKYSNFLWVQWTIQWNNPMEQSNGQSIGKSMKIQWNVENSPSQKSWVLSKKIIKSKDPFPNSQGQTWQGCP